MSDLSENTIKELLTFAYRASPDRGAHITRYSMYRALNGRLSSFDSPNRNILAISHSAPFGMDVLGLKNAKYTTADYPEQNILDLHFADEQFDGCISDQVLEHVEGDPFVAVKETCRVIRPGGYVVHTTCFVNEIHGVPKDFWRFTPDALSLLVKAAGCDVVEVGSWGNREMWKLIRGGFRFEGVPNDPQNPIHRLATRNEPDWPVVVWVLGQKSDAPHG